MPVQIQDVVVPEGFTQYIVENSLVSTALFQSGVAVENGVMSAQLSAGAESFTVPCWNDLTDTEANIGTDDPTDVSTPFKINAYSQNVRKSFLNQAWSEMNLASELSGSDALTRIQSRVMAYWNRQYEFRLFASLLGIMDSNVANDSGDMVYDISLQGEGTVAPSNLFNYSSFVEACGTLGDRMEDIKALAVHSAVYKTMQSLNQIDFIRDSDNNILFQTYGGKVLIQDDNLTIGGTPGVYISVLFGAGAVGFATAPPRTGYGTELFRAPNAGNGSGLTELHSRINLAIHPLGFSWSDSSGENALAGPSPMIADLKKPAHWTRVATQRKSIPLAFLVSNG